MQLFYAPDFATTASALAGYAAEDIQQAQLSYLLNAEESRHLIKVLRYRAGQALLLTDGRGSWFDAVLEDPDPRSCGLKVLGWRQAAPRAFRLHLAVAPTKNIDRFEWFLEKATELGVEDITPIICENAERTSIKEDRLGKILISAMKQSLRAWLPVLHPAVSFGSFIHNRSNARHLIAHCHGSERLDLNACVEPGCDVTIMIGPEGDFSQKEVQLSLEAGCIPLQLGHYRLRTETAALAACMGINLINKQY